MEYSLMRKIFEDKETEKMLAEAQYQNERIG